VSRKSVSVAGAARRARSEDARLRQAQASAAQVKAPKGKPSLTVPSADSFVNFAFKMGIGADNPLSSAGYGFNPITRVRTTLEWIHRGSWLGGIVTDSIADDMTRAGVDLKGGLDPADMTDLHAQATRLQIWGKLNETAKWARLYGGCIAVLLIEGQDPSTPLRPETVGKDQFKGLAVLDRWMVEPTLNNLVTELGPELGRPKFYLVRTDGPVLPRAKIHYSRCIRLVGIELPYWQRVQENLWGISVLERLYDRMIAFDSATTGAAQLVYKAYLRTYKIKGLRQILAAGGPALTGLLKMVEFMRMTQSNEGVTLLDTDDEFEVMQHSAFSGLSDVLGNFEEQLAGATGIPLVRMFGQSPKGFSTGDTDLRNYYDSIGPKQENELHVGVELIYRVLARSSGLMELPDDFDVKFRPLWQMTDAEKADVFTKVVSGVVQAQEAMLMSDRTAMQELRQSSEATGIGTNITDEDIERASDVPEPPEPELGAEGGGAGGADQPQSGGGNGKSKPNGKATTDSAGLVARAGRVFGVQVAIENAAGTERIGSYGTARQPAPYGYIRGTIGADGDQVDCFLGSGDGVWVIEQVDPDTRRPDEAKVMLGFNSLVDALSTYTAAYPDGRGMDRVGSVTGMSAPEFQAWVAQRGIAGQLQAPVTGKSNGAAHA